MSDSENQEENLEKIETVDIKEIEGAATAQGWSPEKGDLSALEFLANGREFRDRLYDKVGKLERENQKVYQIVADHITSQQAQATQNQQEEIEAQIKEATEAGDTDKVLSLTKKLTNPAPQSDPKTDFVDAWVADNKWFDESLEMKADATGFYQAEATKLGADNPQVILPKVLERMKETYPKYFNPENPNKDRGSGAETKGKKQSSKKPGLKREDLTEDEGRHIDQFIKMGMKEEKLLESIQRGRAQRGQ